jgi:S1-C subfamily serine protease
MVLNAQTDSVRHYTVPELVKEMSLGIVHIAALDARGKTTSLGSGFVVDTNGTVVSSYHLLDGAAGAQIKTSDNEIYDRVEVLDFDIRRDIIVLKIRPFRPLKAALRLAESDDVTIGEEVAVIGNPEGLEASVSAGIVSGRRQASGYQMLQTTAPISPGSSGGPLFNMQGRVIGVTASQINDQGAQNLNFAVPILYLRPLLAGSQQALSFPEFIKKVAESPVSGLRASASSRPPNTRVSWKVIHDHGGSFSTRCSGTLTLTLRTATLPAELMFQSESVSSDNWRVPLSDLVEAAKNAIYGSDARAFHLTLRGRDAINFIALDDNGKNADGGNVAAVIRSAAGENR